MTSPVEKAKARAYDAQARNFDAQARLANLQADLILQQLNHGQNMPTYLEEKSPFDEY